MAIYSFSTSVIQRSRGKSALEAAAYQAREQLWMDREDKPTKNYKNRSELSSKPFILVPDNAPDWAKGRGGLWNRVEAVENRKNSQLARSMVIALPHEITEEQRRILLTKFLNENFVSKGLAADVAMHAPDKRGDNRNYHAHVLVTMRRFDDMGFVKHKNRDWSNRTEQKAQLEGWRKSWAYHCSAALTEAGFENESKKFLTSYMSLRAQRVHALAVGNDNLANELNRLPTTHMGTIPVAIKRRGGKPYRDGTPYGQLVMVNQTSLVFMDRPTSLGHASVSFNYNFKQVASIFGGQKSRQTKWGQTKWRDPQEALAAREISAIWKTTKTAEEFQSAVKNAGYSLARGNDRDFLIIDAQGGYYNLARLVRDAKMDDHGKMRSTVKTADIRERLGNIRKGLPYLSFKQSADGITKIAAVRRMKTTYSPPTRLRPHPAYSARKFVSEFTEQSHAAPHQVNSLRSGLSLNSGSQPVSGETRRGSVTKSFRAAWQTLESLQDIPIRLGMPGIFSASKARTTRRVMWSAATRYDISVIGRAQAAFDHFFALYEAKIHAAMSDKSKTPEQREAAIKALRQKQQQEASAERKRILNEESKRTDNARREARSARIMRR